MSQYPSSPAIIAESLRWMADRLATVPDVAPAVLAVSLSIQIHQNYGTQPERIDAVDTLLAGLGMGEGKAEDTLYGNPSRALDHLHRFGPIDISVYTGVQSQRELDLQAENARLRAQLENAATKPTVPTTDPGDLPRALGGEQA